MPPSTGLGFADDDNSDITGSGTFSSTPSADAFSGMLGTNKLQASIDKFAAAVDKLAALYSKASGAVGGGSGFSNGPGGQGTTLPSSSSGGFMAGVTKAFGMVTGIPVTPSGTGNAGGATFSGGTGGGGRSGGGGGSGSAFPGGGMGSAGFPKRAIAEGSLIGGVLGTVAAVAEFGKAQMTEQVAMSGFAQQQQLMGSASIRQIQAAAFGARNQGLPSMALSYQDVIQGQSTINSLGGTATNIPGPGGAFFRAGQGGAASFSYANPMGGLAQAANMSAQMFSPQFSQSMMMMGYGKTPLSSRGKGPQMNSAATLQAMTQGMFRGGKVSRAGMALSLRTGGTAQMDLENLLGTSDPATINAWTAALEQQNKLTQGNASMPGLNAAQSQALLSQATKSGPGQNAARTTLGRYGITESDLTKMTSKNAVNTGRASDMSGAFNQGLSAATSGLTKFEEVLTNIVNLPGLHQFLGVGSGALGTVAGMGAGGGLAGLGSLGVQALMLKRMTGLAAGGAAGSLVAGEGGAGLGGGAATGAPVAGMLAAEGGLSAAVTSLAPIVLGLIAVPTIAKAAGDLLGGKNYQKNLNEVNKVPAGGPPVLGPAAKAIGDPIIAGIMTMFEGLTHMIGNKTASRDLGGFFDSVRHQAAASVDAIGSSVTHLGGASGSSGKSGTLPSAGAQAKGGNRSIPAAAGEAVAFAERQVGKPYVWGGVGPSGFDCSGLVMDAYQHAGITLPRTSEEQWAALKNRSVPLDKAEEGDIVFQAGADGSFASPGHEALMINSNQIVEAAGTGIPVRIRGYSDKEWQHVGRPRGGLGAGGGGVGGTGTTTEGNTGLPANSASAMGIGLGSYGSSEEVDDVSSALGGGSGGSFMSTQQAGGTPAAGGSGSGKGAGGGTPGGSTAPGGTAAQNRALGKKLAAKYGWGSGKQWAALDWLWGTAEDNWDNRIWNGGSHAASQPPGSSGAYGIAQADPYTKYPKAGQPPGAGGSASAGAQESWGLAYIKGRYQNPVNAKAYHLSHNSYAEGTGNALEGMAWVGERGPELKHLNQGDQIFPAGVSQHLAKTLNTKPTEAPWAALLSQPPGSTQAAGSGFSIVFEAGSIVIGEGTDKQVAKHTVDAICKELEKRELLGTVTSGQKFGDL